jgi:hypothetical protein
VDVLVYRSENESLVPQSPCVTPVASLFGQINCRRGAVVVVVEPRIGIGVVVDDGVGVVVDDGAAAAAVVVVVPESLADNDDIEQKKSKQHLPTGGSAEEASLVENPVPAPIETVESSMHSFVR